MEKILVVDDMPNTRFAMAEVLKSEGYEVIEAENGQEGIDLSLAELPDLIIMDVMMSKMDGIEAVENIRKNPQTKNIPIFMNTAKENVKSEFVREKGREVQGFLEKPYKTVQLTEKVNDFFNK